MTYLSAKDFILGIRGGGVLPLDGFGGPTGFFTLPITDGNLRPNFPLVVDVVSVVSATDSGLNPGGKNELTDSVSILSNSDDMSNLKSEFELWSISGFVFSFSSSACCLKPGGRNALISSNSSLAYGYECYRDWILRFFEIY